MHHDPKGYYARLELEWDATPDAIHAAYRRKARLLHPDIPVTGDAAAFVALKQAYDVLADPLQRAAYARSGRSFDQLRAAAGTPPVYTAPPPPPPPHYAPPRRRRYLPDLPVGVWAIMALVLVFGGIEAVLHFVSPPGPPERTVEVPAMAPSVPPQTTPEPARPVRLYGVTNVYVIPAGGPALVLRYDPTRQGFVPIGQLPAFSVAQATRVLRDHGLVEIRLTDTAVGFIEATRLAPGNGLAAHRAYCTYNAGPSPTNGEILARNGVGAGTLRIENRSGDPMVVKLRDRTGIAAATVFLTPGDDATVTGLPGGDYRPDFAVGNVWSRACNEFAVGMRAQRFSTFASLAALGTLVVPPDLPTEPPPADISDQEFEHE